MDMKLTFLGTGNAFGHDGRRRSHYLLEGSLNYLIDASYDALPGLRSINKSILDIDTIFLSHLHPDHYMALPQFALENFYVLKRTNPVQVYGPQGTADTIRNATRLMYNEDILNHLEDLYTFTEIPANETRNITNGKLETFEADHSGNGRMQKITLDDVVIGYTGDTGFVPSVFEILLDADVTITEASSGSHPIPNHITVTELLDYPIPPEKVVYLTHLGTSSIEMADQISPPLYLAYDGLTIEL